jgi:hypothetical protein
MDGSVRESSYIICMKGMLFFLFHFGTWWLALLRGLVGRITALRDGTLYGMRILMELTCSVPFVER